MKAAIIFPGQGCQFIGMGKEFYDSSERSRMVIDSVNELIGFDLKKRIYEGTPESLKETSITQPVMYAVTNAIYEGSKEKIFAAKGIEVIAMAGNSLGEYNALTASGSLTFQDGIRIVNKRGKLMQMIPGQMCALSKKSNSNTDEQLREALEKYGMEVSLYNSSKQVVLGGSGESIDNFLLDAKKLGIIAKRLETSGPFHTSFMKPIAEEFQGFLSDFKFHRPEYLIFQNHSANPATDEDELKKGLISQLYSAVRWHQSVLNMIGQGVEMFIEVCPKPVLSKIIDSESYKNIKTLSISKPEDLLKLEEYR